MTDIRDDGTWDDDDRAIARALGAPESPVTGVSPDDDAFDAAVAEYQAVLSHLPFDAVEPRADLEEQVIAAALAERPAAARAIDGSRTAVVRRSNASRWVAAAAVTVAAAAIVVALAAGRPGSGSGPATGARIQPASSTETVQRVLAERGTRVGVMRAGTGAAVGRVALGPDGQAFLYDLASSPASGAQWLWLDTGAGAVRVGHLPRGSTVHFVVHGSPSAVTAVFLTNEASAAAPSTPGPVRARAPLPSR